MKKILLSLALMSAAASHAAPQQNGNTLTFDTSSWWQVEIPWRLGGGVICNRSDNIDTCVLEPGEYKWLQDGSTGTVSVSGNSQPTATTTAPAALPIQFVIQRKRCEAGQNFETNRSANCVARCSIGKAISGTCTASTDMGLPQMIRYSRTNDPDWSENGHYCSTGRFGYSIEAQVTCVIQ